LNGGARPEFFLRVAMKRISPYLLA